ncbi:hypothetical protein CcaCcLH18_11113 [Colletotrichum camelliae]|nr:hypothetical protein CcaCcLH18_11113 [Colletotrichum camelliae]
MRMQITLSLVAAAAVQLVAAGDFSKTCNSMSYFSTTLSAKCANNDYEPYDELTDIDLTRCLANVGGQVVIAELTDNVITNPQCRPGSPSFKFCDCGLAGDKKTLNCRCTDSTGTKKPSSLNLGMALHTGEFPS